MKKRYIAGGVSIIVILWFIFVLIFGADKANTPNSSIPHIGQKLWTYDTNAHKWSAYNANHYDDLNKNVILELKMPSDNSISTTYNIITSNPEIPSNEVEFGETSKEFVIGNSLYSYYPSQFAFYQILYNGVKFAPKNLGVEIPDEIIKNHKIIKVSELQNGDYELVFKKNKNKFIIINDIGDKFYKYYIVPNYNSKLQIGDFSNEFEVTEDVTIKLQRIEGCTKSYPCYTINAKLNK